MTASNEKKATLLLILVVVVFMSMRGVPIWYELKDSVVYQCVSNGDTASICMNIDDPSDAYDLDMYKPDMIGAEYYEFRASGMRSCVVLRKGNVYEIETLCGVTVTDTAEFLSDGTL